LVPLYLFHTCVLIWYIVPVSSSLMTNGGTNISIYKAAMVTPRMENINQVVRQGYSLYPTLFNTHTHKTKTRCLCVCVCM